MATVVACLPYFLLKMAWIAGWSIGSDDPSFTDTTRVANIATACLELVGITLAWLMIRPLAQRIPAFVVAGPLWIGTGLLAPIAVGLPIGTSVQILTGGGSPLKADEGMHAWVFAVVYGGFICQAVLLSAGFALYALARWPVATGGGRTSGGRTGGGAGSTKPLQDLLGWFFIPAAIAYGVQQVVWAAISGGQFDDIQTAQRVFLCLGAAIAVGGAWAYAGLLRGRRLTRTRLALAWTGSGVVFTGALSLMISAASVQQGDWGSTGVGPGETTMTLFILLCALGGAIGGALRLVEEQRP